MIAIETDAHMKMIKLLVKSKPSLLLIKNNEEVPPIIEAVKKRRLDVVKLMVEYGANVNETDLDQETPLHIAASNSDYDMIEYFLKKTEVDPTALNRDQMNAICLLIVRARNEDAILIDRCFYILLEKSYEKNPITKTYAISDIFKCAFLASVYSQTEVVKYLIHNVYSVNNSMYKFIIKLSECCEGQIDEYLYYILVFIHDDIDNYEKFSFPRFSEINYFMSVRSVIYIMEMMLLADDAVEMTITLLQHLKSIGMKIRVREFEDQVGALFQRKFSSFSPKLGDDQKVDKIFEYFRLNGFKLNLMIKSFLHSIAISKSSLHNICVETAIKILNIILYHATTFFSDLENWRQINDFRTLNPTIRKIVLNLAQKGTSELNDLLDLSTVFSLKHLCRNKIREQVKFDPNILCNHQVLSTLSLPDVLTNYIVFKNE